MMWQCLGGRDDNQSPELRVHNQGGGQERVWSLLPPCVLGVLCLLLSYLRRFGKVGRDLGTSS